MGTPLRHSNFYRRAWLPAVAKAGLPGIHFHDLRHAGNTLTEVSGVAAAASFGGSGERALPAVQRAALEQARSHGSSCTVRDLGCHHLLASSRTMMQPVRLQ
jgi:integrase